MSDTNLDSLSVSCPLWIGRRTEAGEETAHVTTAFRLQSHQARERNGNMILYLSAFPHHNCSPLKRCKNIYYVTKLDVLFCTVWCDSLILALDIQIQIHLSPCSLFLHRNELVNIQMTPQKNWHLERIEYKHLYSFLHAHDWIFLLVMHQNASERKMKEPLITLPSLVNPMICLTSNLSRVSVTTCN